MMFNMDDCFGIRYYKEFYRLPAPKPSSFENKPVDATDLKISSGFEPLLAILCIVR